MNLNQENTANAKHLKPDNNVSEFPTSQTVKSEHPKRVADSFPL